MEDAFLVNNPPKAETQKRTSRQATRQALTRLQFCATTLYILASIALVILLFTMLPDKIGGTDWWDFLCADTRNKAAMVTFFSEHLDAFAHYSTAKKMATILKIMFRMNPMSITLGWGPFGFPIVKAIDIVWNLVISRVGQIFFGITTYKVIMAWLIQQMKSQSVPYQLVREVTLSKGYSVMLLWSLFKTRRGSKLWKQHQIQLVGFVFCIIFVLVYPILADAMTGYRATGVPYVQTIDGDLLHEGHRDDGRAATIKFSLDNGHLLGLSDPTYVWFSGNNRSGLAQPGLPTKLTAFEGLALFREVFRLQNNCTQSCNVFHWPDGDNVTLSKGQELIIRSMPESATDPAYIIDGELVTMQDFLSDRLVCVSQSTYLWGFSWHLLLLWSILNVVHTSILLVSWHRLKNYTGIRRPYGVHRAMIDLANMSQDIIGEDIHLMTDDEIKDSLDRARAGLMTCRHDGKVVALATT